MTESTSRAQTAARVSRGKPEPDDEKVTVRLWLDTDVIGAYKADGPDWEDRMNADLPEAMKLKVR